MTAYPCCECCLTDLMHPDQHEVACPTCDNPAADRLRAERGELADKLAHMREARDNARAEVERLTALIEAVRKLHREVTIEYLDLECVLGTCGHKRQCPPLVAKGCAHCGAGVYPYPCPTIRALDATGGVS